MAEAIFELETRRRYAEVLRHFAAGLTTTDQYESAAMKIPGFLACDACQSVYDEVWTCYSDVWPHRLRGKRKLSTTARRYVAQGVLFLRSGKSVNAVPTCATASCETSSTGSRWLGAGCVTVLAIMLLVLAIMNVQLVIAMVTASGLVTVTGSYLRQCANEFVAWLRDEPIEETPLDKLWPFAQETDYADALKTAGYLGRTGAVAHA